MKAPQIRLPFLRSIIPRTTTPTITTHQIRFASDNRTPPPVPAPIPLVPDVPTFLKVVGRGLSQYTDKFPSWEALFTLSSDQMRELGVEPPRTRRYLLAWLDRYRRGALGPGGDFKHVENGEAVLKVASDPAQTRKWVVNVPSAEINTIGESNGHYVSGYKIVGTHTIAGPFATQLKEGQGATVKVFEGMWEQKRGHKVDGGERRRAEVRYKRRVAQRRAEKEAALGGR
ncbi:IGR protein motif-domain-containing protein [Plectosphaerella plurivora]|uniref:Small ribosomal subunit protein mS41 n=1 Tax=Plectosphaerella plurivora TaxID=936078 RepID=A0A9P8VFT9_9PEZI|nr:IGR protein motif-domain-containing protein [Plectosphaerella plurivora]